MSKTKALTAEQNKRVVELMLALRRKLGGQEKLGKALGVSQTTISEVLDGKKGAGGKILAGLTRVAAAELAIAMGGEPPPEPQPELDTLSMARQAAENLVTAKVTDLDRAWLLMRDLRVESPTVEKLTSEGLRAHLGLNPGEGAGNEATPTSRPPSPAASGRPSRTRYAKRRASGG